MQLDRLGVSIERELRLVAEEGEGVDVQVFEVEKIYVLGTKTRDSGPKKTPQKAPPAAAAEAVVGGGGSSTLVGGASGGPAVAEEAPLLQYSFIRRRTQAGFSVYGHTTVSRHPSG